MAHALYHGDNLDMLPRYFTDASVDLVYLDPFFNTPPILNKRRRAAGEELQTFMGFRTAVAAGATATLLLL